MSEASFQAPPGLLALTSPGLIRVETSMAVTAAMLEAQKAGLQLTMQHFGGALVDKARNDAARAMLAQPLGFALYIDGDMVFQPNAVLHLVQTAYQMAPWADVVGGYCNLRGGVAVPTIDTGTGTWESHYPGSGVKEVIRTGGAFLLVKRHVFEQVPEPWFALRHPMRWLDAFAEIDNFARTKLDGANPFRNLPGSPWEKLIDIARGDPQSQRRSAGFEVGEDSGFCDRVKMAGLRIAVQTDIEVGHIDSQVLTGATHKERMDKREVEHRQVYGILR